MIKPVLVGKAKLPFSHAIRLGDLVFISGQASVDLATGDIIAGTFAEEMSQSVENSRD